MTRHFSFDSKSFDSIRRADLGTMTPENLEAWAWEQHELARTFLNMLIQDSNTSSKPPSSDNPYTRGAKEESKTSAQDDVAASPEAPEKKAKTGKLTGATGKKAGKQLGAKGFWRTTPVVPTEEVRHAPTVCDGCGSVLGADLHRRCDSAHNSFELSRGFMSMHVTATRHAYFAVTCPCGHETVARPSVGARSEIEGRRKNLQMSERCLVGPLLATYIAALSVRFFMSRSKIREYLLDWLGLELGRATIERCIHEFGLACEPVVEQLIQENRNADILHVDETPWYQRGKLRWLWVTTTALTTVFHIGSRRKEELIELIGESFLGWLVTDGYGAYRDHERRQRCLAHLIRKGLALALGHYGAGSDFGRSFVYALRRLIERIRDGEDADTPAVKRLMARIKWNCQCNRYVDEKKVRELAGEVLNDWDAIVAFAYHPSLPPTNNDAERALRHAVIARRISFGTRTDEGSRLYASALSVVETCRRRGVDTWAYAASLIAAARAGLPPPAFPTRAVA
jgi:hypothetical protein